ncbi:MAG: DUF2252 family protein [Bdellovibrionaceae bacterium]|nr:DUF2252 family protein [Pseudobdellovibrionaceae bacterium]
MKVKIIFSSQIIFKRILTSLDSLLFTILLLFFFSANTNAKELSCPIQSQGEAVLTKIQSLPPQIDILDQKIISLLDGNSPFMFFRSFVAYYYLTAKEMLSTKELDMPQYFYDESSSQDYWGWCAGDAHPDNFGAMFITGTNKPVFTINDPDDAGYCPLSLDILRFLTGVLLYEEDYNLVPVLESYQSGVLGKYREFSKPVNKLLKKAYEKGTELKDGDFKNGDPKSRRLERNLDDFVVSEISHLEKQDLIAFVESKLSAKATLLDAIKFYKTDGGSGGLYRYKLLLDLEQKPFIIELKAIDSPGVVGFSENQLEAVDRFTTTFTMEYGALPQFPYSVHEIEPNTNLEFHKIYVRPRWSGNQKISLEDFSGKPDSISDIIKDEAYVLGLLHGRSPNDKYKTAVENLDVKAWIHWSKSLSKKLKNDYLSLRSCR